jgi:hypothetical protein
MLEFNKTTNPLLQRAESRGSGGSFAYYIEEGKNENGEMNFLLAIKQIWIDEECTRQWSYWKFHRTLDEAKAAAQDWENKHNTKELK